MLPFDLPFRVGNDICRIERIRRILKRRGGHRFVYKILTPSEIHNETTAGILAPILQTDTRHSESQDRAAPTFLLDSRYGDPQFNRAAEFMAGRFAAKEAVMKAHSKLGLTFQHIVIIRDIGFRDLSILKQAEESAPKQTEESTASQAEALPQAEGHEQEAQSPPKQRGSPLVAKIYRQNGLSPLYASVCVSHDTDYATAVCLGVNFSLLMKAFALQASSHKAARNSAEGVEMDTT